MTLRQPHLVATRCINTRRSDPLLVDEFGQFSGDVGLKLRRDVQAARVVVDRGRLVASQRRLLGGLVGLRGRTWNK